MSLMDLMTSEKNTFQLEKDLSEKFETISGKTSVKDLATILNEVEIMSDVRFSSMNFYRYLAGFVILKSIKCKNYVYRSMN